MSTHTHRLAHKHDHVRLILDHNKVLQVIELSTGTKHSIIGDLAQLALLQSTNATAAQYNELRQGRAVIVQYNE